MFIFAQRRARRRRYVIGAGFFDWISSAASTLPGTLARAAGSAGSFLSANKDTISNTAEVIGNVAKAGATTATAAKQVVDAIKAKRAQSAAKSRDGATLPKSLEKALSQKSIDFLQQLARETVRPETATAATATSINARIAGSGFKTLQAGGKAKGKGPQ